MVNNAAMPIHPDLAPHSAPARPELTGGRRIGVLVQHGFTGSPWSVRAWAEHLAGRGYAVEVPLLPGHGTSWRELNGTGWDDWYGEVRRAFDSLLASNDAVVVAGLSLGGGLVLRLAADRPDDVSGIALVNPAVNTTRRDVKALPVLKWVVPAFPAIANDIKKEGQDERAYPRTPLKAAHSMMQGWRALRADLGRVRAPILMFRSVEDHVVDPSSGRIITSSVSSTDVTERLLENSFHVATLDHDADAISSETADFVARVTA